MTSDALSHRVLLAVAEVSGVPCDALREESTLSELGIDSLDSSALRLELEERFNISVTNEDALALAFKKTIGDIIDCVRKFVSEPFGISTHDAKLLFEKLITERIQITVWFTSLGDAAAFFPGTLERFSIEDGFFIRCLPHGGEFDGCLTVPIKGRTVSYSYCDERDFMDVPQEIRTAVGSIAVRARFMDITETLVLMFSL